jgi:hypothetical protein
LQVNYFGMLVVWSALIQKLVCQPSTMHTFFAGTKRITDSLLPYIRNAKGRIVKYGWRC